MKEKKDEIPWDAPKPWRAPGSLWPFLDPSKEYPNGLGLTTAEINAGYESLARTNEKLKREAEARAKAKRKGKKRGKPKP